MDFLNNLPHRGDLNYMSDGGNLNQRSRNDSDGFLLGEFGGLVCNLGLKLGLLLLQLGQDLVGVSLAPLIVGLVGDLILWVGHFVLGIWVGWQVFLRGSLVLLRRDFVFGGGSLVGFDDAFLLDRDLFALLHVVSRALLVSHGAASLLGKSFALSTVNVSANL